MDTKSLDIANSERQLKEKSVSSTVRAFSALTNPFEMSFGWLVGFLTSSSIARLYRERAPRQSV